MAVPARNRGLHHGCHSSRAVGHANVTGNGFRDARRLPESPEVVLGVADETFIERLRSTATSHNATGNRIHDAEIVAFMRQHRVGRIVTADRDFLRFDGIEVALVEP